MTLYPSYKWVIWTASSLMATGVGVGCSSILLNGPRWLTLSACLLTGVSAAVPVGIVFRIQSSLRWLTDSLCDSKRSLEQIRMEGPLNSLIRAIEDRFRSATEHMNVIDKQNKDLSLQSQLLRKQKQNTQAIIYGIRDAVLVIDAGQCLIMANQAAETLFGFRFDPREPRPASELIRHSQLLAMMDKSRTSRLTHVKHELTVEQGKESLIFDCIISCVTDDGGTLVSVVAVLHDITREKEIAQMKNDFVSHVSHELKTPLASINAYAEMLVDGEAKDTATLNQFCSIIQTQAQRLNRLIEDILNISRIESGLIKVNKQSISLSLIIHDAVEMIRSYAQEKNIAVHTPASIIYDQVYADKDMITQVVINLLSNAVKYTPNNGSVTVQTEVNDADQRVRVSITDTGVGIPPDDLPRLFEKFFRVEANKNMAKGTGLGLSLVKQIVEKVHNGKVFVASTQGKGSTFGFQMPMGVPAAAMAS